MKFSILSSGSKQNCFYIESSRSAILVDIGLPFSILSQHLQSVGGSLSKIQALFITHEHWDHIQGLRSLLKNQPVPVYMNEDSRHSAGVKLSDHRAIIHQEMVALDGLEILPFQVNHDAANTFGFRIREGDKSLFIASDIGSFDEAVIQKCRDADAIAIESNYDLEMLKHSPYPAHLKKRIHGSNGHLSNRDAVIFLAKTITRRTKNVFFLHLSENNNSESIVEKIIREYLVKHYPGVRFHVSHREKPTALVEL